jgi:DNA topoisomerase IB
MALVIPPAWDDVRICPHLRGHGQGVGTDAAVITRWQVRPCPG